MVPSPGPVAVPWRGSAPSELEASPCEKWRLTMSGRQLYKVLRTQQAQDPPSCSCSLCSGGGGLFLR